MEDVFRAKRPTAEGSLPQEEDPTLRVSKPEGTMRPEFYDQNRFPATCQRAGFLVYWSDAQDRNARGNLYPQ